MKVRRGDKGKKRQERGKSGRAEERMIGKREEGGGARRREKWARDLLSGCLECLGLGDARGGSRVQGLGFRV